MKKKLLTVALAAVMTVSSALSAFAAAESINGVDWWNEANTASTPVTIADGDTIKFKVDVEATDEEDKYAAFIVEATDGTNWMTSTSAGDIWGNGDPTKDLDKANAAKGGSYTVTVARSGNNFDVTYVDNATGSALFNTLKLAGTADFAATTTVYVKAMKGAMSVEQIVDAPSTEDNSDTTAATEGATTAGDNANNATTAGTAGGATTPNTGDATMVGLLVAVAAASAVVVLKKRTVAE